MPPSEGMLGYMNDLRRLEFSNTYRMYESKLQGLRDVELADGSIHKVNAHNEDVRVSSVFIHCLRLLVSGRRLITIPPLRHVGSTSRSNTIQFVPMTTLGALITWSKEFGCDTSILGRRSFTTLGLAGCRRIKLPARLPPRSVIVRPQSTGSIGGNGWRITVEL